MYLLLPVEPSWETLRPHLCTLTVFAVGVRYPGESADKTMAREALTLYHNVRRTLVYERNRIQDFLLNRSGLRSRHAGRLDAGAREERTDARFRGITRITRDEIGPEGPVLGLYSSHRLAIYERQQPADEYRLGNFHHSDDRNRLIG